MSSSPTEPRARVLLVNPNTNVSTTQMMRDYAAAALPEFDVVGVTGAQGPSMIVDPVALAESVEHVIEAVRRARESGDIAAVIVAAIGDPGRRELDELLDVPVVGIGQACVLAASAGGRPFGMATSTPALAESLGGLAAEHGGSARFVGVRLTTSEPLVLAADPERQFEELAEAVDACAGDGAEAVIIAGGPLSQTARRLAERSATVIVEPIPSACTLLRQRLTVGGSSR